MKVRSVLIVEIGIECDIMIPYLGVSIRALNSTCVDLTCNNNFGLEVCILNPLHTFLKLREASLISHIAGVDEDVAFGQFEGLMRTCIMRVGNADKTCLTRPRRCFCHGLPS